MLRFNILINYLKRRVFYFIVALTLTCNFKTSIHVIIKSIIQHACFAIKHLIIFLKDNYLKLIFFKHLENYLKQISNKERAKTKQIKELNYLNIQYYLLREQMNNAIIISSIKEHIFVFCTCNYLDRNQDQYYILKYNDNRFFKICTNA